MNLKPPPVEMPVDENGGKVHWSWLQWLQNLYRTYSLLLGAMGAGNLNAPYGSISSRSTQTVGGANTPTRVSFDTTDYLNGMTRVVGDGLHVTVAGTYNLQYSLQMVNPDTSICESKVWIRKNGTDLAYSNNKVSITASHGGADGYTRMTDNLYVTLAASDYVEVWYASTSATTNLEAYTAQVSPYAAPGVPSAQLTLSFVSS